jgi:hypothetical protein
MPLSMIRSLARVVELVKETDPGDGEDADAVPALWYYPKMVRWDAGENGLLRGC